MGCQREIAQQILDQGGDHILALKENEETLYHDVVGMFALAQAKTIENLVVAENFAVLRHLALNLLSHQQTKRLSIKGKRLKAAWATNFLFQVLGAI